MFRNLLADTISRLCSPGHESAVLNRIPSLHQPPRRSPPPPRLYLWHGGSSNTEAVNPHCVAAEVNFTGQFQHTHQHHIPRTKLTAVAFPEMRVCFGVHCGLAFMGIFFFFFFFQEEVELGEIECSFLLAEHPLTSFK